MALSKEVKLPSCRIPKINYHKFCWESQIHSISVYLTSHIPIVTSYKVRYKNVFVSLYVSQGYLMLPW